MIRPTYLHQFTGIEYDDDEPNALDLYYEKYYNSYVPLLFLRLCSFDSTKESIRSKHNVDVNAENVFCYLGTKGDNIAYVLNKESKLYDRYIGILRTFKKYDFIEWNKFSVNAKWIFFTKIKKDAALYSKYSDMPTMDDWYAFEIETIIQNLQNLPLNPNLKFFFQPFEVDYLTEALLGRNHGEPVLCISPGMTALAGEPRYEKVNNYSERQVRNNLTSEFPTSDLAEAVTRLISNSSYLYSSLEFTKDISGLKRQFVIGCSTLTGVNANFEPLIRRGLNHTEEGGNLVLTLPATFLYNKTNKQIRRYLLEHNLIRTIVDLPAEICTVDTPNLILLKIKKDLTRTDAGGNEKIKFINATGLVARRDDPSIDQFNYTIYRIDYTTICHLIQDSEYIGKHFEDNDNRFSLFRNQMISEESYHHLVHFVEVSDFINNDYNLNYANIYTKGRKEICLIDTLDQAPFVTTQKRLDGKYISSLPNNVETLSSSLREHHNIMNISQVIDRDALLADKYNIIRPKVVRCKNDEVLIGKNIKAFYPRPFISIDTILRSLLSKKFQGWQSPYFNGNLLMEIDSIGFLFRTIEKPILNKQAEREEVVQKEDTLDVKDDVKNQESDKRTLKLSDQVLERYLGKLDKSQRQAAEYVLDGHSVFITGKAGTGKSTLLHALEKLYRHLHKNVVVAAPTGVAARVAGGQTLHSLLHLPIAPYIPGMRLKGLFSLPEEGVYLVRHLDVLFIDEMSMVRSDLLDMIDVVLRHYRKSDSPFGGIQLVMLGDLYQLMPVVKEEDWKELSKVYKTPYFFSSKAYQKLDCSMVELTEIHRQNDTEFTTLLNNVREGHVSYDEMKILSSRYVENFHSKDDSYIRLTTHNYRADRYNASMMDDLTTQSHVYKAKIEGYYPIDEFPTEEYLKLKVGARVMFIRNDNDGKQFVNGTLGTVIRLGDWEVGVKTDDGKIIDVERYSWDFMKYKMNKRTNEIEQTKVGTFKQYPLKLAWAVTIHKSQGLEFDKVVIDAGRAFAYGQVYVALSRCKNLFGIVLVSKISRDIIKTDPAVVDFMKTTKRLGSDGKIYRLGDTEQDRVHVRLNETEQTTLWMLQNGLTLEQIAEQKHRQMGFIIADMMKLIRQGEVDVHEYVSDKDYALIKQVIDNHGISLSVADIRTLCNNKVDVYTINLVKASLTLK